MEVKCTCGETVFATRDGDSCFYSYPQHYFLPAGETGPNPAFPPWHYMHDPNSRRCMQSGQVCVGA